MGHICPSGTTQVGPHNADIAGCGIKDCGARYGSADINACHAACIAERDCKSFTWADIGGDPNHSDRRVCTLYNSDANTGTNGFQIMCKVEIIYPSMNCIWDPNWVNGWDGHHDNNDNGMRFLSGQHSVHDNYREDRLFKWKYCKPNGGAAAYGETFALPQTAYDEHFTRDCGGRFGEDHAAMIGGTSYHHNHFEDRQWTFKCGRLNPQIYALRNCAKTSWVNGFDGAVNYECPNNGVIKKIESYHHNHHEDRLWSFECCQVTSYSFGRPSGAWVPLNSCTGCGPLEYQVESGIEASHTESFSQEYSKELSMTVSAGYSYGGVYGTVSAEVSVTGTISQTTASAMENSFARSKIITMKIPCDKNNFYQWRQTVRETLPGIDDRDIHVYGSIYLCTDNTNPVCPAGWCQNDDCTTCKSGYTTGAAPIHFDIFNFEENSHYISYQFRSNPTASYLVALLAVLFLINIVCCCGTYFGWFGAKKKTKNQYKIVSMTSDEDRESDAV